MSWVLRDGVNYFRGWGNIGPQCTKDKAEARRFATKKEAMQSHAYSFPIMSFEPVNLANKESKP